MSPLWCSRLSNRVLVAEQTSLVHRLVQRHSVEPAHPNEVLRLFWIVSKLTMIRARSENFEGWTISFLSRQGKLRRPCGCLRYDTDADEALLRSLNPNAVTDF